MPQVSTDTTNNPLNNQPTYMPSYFTCKFCERDDFKSARGRDYHLNFCEEFKLSQASLVLNSEPSVSPPGAELPGVIKDPTQNHSVPIRLIPKQKSDIKPTKYTSFEKLPRIKLPKASDTKAWSHINTTITHKMGKHYTTRRIDNKALTTSWNHLRIRSEKY